MFLTENILSFTETNQFMLYGECRDFTVNAGSGCSNRCALKG